MRVKPVLGDWEIPRIESIETVEQRDFVELAVPGMSGSLFQDMNTEPTCIVIRGSLYGDETRDDFLETLRGKYCDGEPVTFVADIVTATQVQYVIIQSLLFKEAGHRPDQLDYHIVLKESPPPPPPSAAPGLETPGLDAIDAGLLDDAGNFLDSVTGALDAIDALGSIPDLQDPTAPLSSTLDEVNSTLSGLADAGTALQSLFGDSG